MSVVHSASFLVVHFQDTWSKRPRRTLRQRTTRVSLDVHLCISQTLSHPWLRWSCSELHRLTHVCLQYRKCGSSVYDAAALVVDPEDSCVRKFAFPPPLVMTQGCIVSVTLPLPPGTFTCSVPRIATVTFKCVLLFPAW